MNISYIEAKSNIYAEVMKEASEMVDVSIRLSNIDGDKDIRRIDRKNCRYSEYVDIPVEIGKVKKPNIYIPDNIDCGTDRIFIHGDLYHRSELQKEWISCLLGRFYVVYGPLTVVIKNEVGVSEDVIEIVKLTSEAIDDDTKFNVIVLCYGDLKQMEDFMA